MTIVWTDDLNTGIDVIDHQHMRLVEYINQLEKASRTHDRLLIGRVLNELVDYTLSHFAFEENLQEEAGYKFAKPHKAIHDMFIKRVAKYQERYSAGEDIAHQLNNMLNTWLLHHIKRDDQSYVAEVKANITKLVQDKKESGWLSRTIGKFFTRPNQPTTP